jgi:hypothetical protein
MGRELGTRLNAMGTFQASACNLSLHWWKFRLSDSGTMWPDQEISLRRTC